MCLFSKILFPDVNLRLFVMMNKLTSIKFQGYRDASRDFFRASTETCASLRRRNSRGNIDLSFEASGRRRRFDTFCRSSSKIRTFPSNIRTKFRHRSRTAGHLQPDCTSFYLKQEKIRKFQFLHQLSFSFLEMTFCVFNNLFSTAMFNLLHS